MLPIIGPLLGNAVGLLGDWLKHKRSITEAETNAKIAIERIKVTAHESRATEGALHEIRWEQHAASGMAASWKDEFFVVVLSLPLVSAMFGYDGAAERAFAAFAAAPEWYQLSFLVAVGASFGVRIWEKLGIGNKARG
jgi:hypothetical protein